MNDYEQVSAFDKDNPVKLSQTDRSGLFPLTHKDYGYFADNDTCRHPEHNPPNYLCVPEGYGYQHVCPRCGKTEIIKNGGPTFRG